ncbi:ABC transporter permease [Salipiger marinus]|uniref:Ribose transport system permease protein n=1 Tax=Salipiger marinus TaxID=555512 RepID=A0A1G8L2Q7_9RHOB|nr:MULTISPECIES: ABC transporter permease [Salipiger]MEB3421316.1 ABC transporter permease [Salipiger manganoxidans]SDI49857.1 ribose transport system permease protein [Salipiger marinus]HBM58827.1 ABC transporter permease [Citreicella sp.]HBT00401.1 ABC transporter permease [Citreicella sp.]
MTGFPNREVLLRWAPLIVLLILMLFFTALEPRFFSVRNFARIAISAAPALMVAVGVTFIILMGSIDLSMEGAVSVCAVSFAFVFLWLGGSLGGWGWLALPLTLVAGAVLGLVNGLVHVRLRIPSFMASLALGFVGTGLAMLMTGGDRIRIEDPAFRALLTTRWLDFPVMIYVAGLFLLLGWFIQSRTTLGRNLYAVGGGEDLAHGSGLNVARVRIMGFMLAGVFYAVGALMAVARIGIAETATGNGFMFTSITAVVVGGTALWGGTGGVWNTLVGVLIVSVIGNGMVVIGLPGYLQDGILGLLVIIAVVLSTDRRSVSIVK